MAELTLEQRIAAIAGEVWISDTLDELLALAKEMVEEGLSEDRAIEIIERVFNATCNEFGA
jgi:hypothetical protein